MGIKLNILKKRLLKGEGMLTCLSGRYQLQDGAGGFCRATVN